MTSTWKALGVLLTGLVWGPGAWAQSKEPTSLANPLAAISLERLAATRDKPLFSPTRRRVPEAVAPAPVAEEPVAVAPPQPPPSLVVSGIVIDGGEARAVVRNKDSNETLRLRAGDMVGDWQVQKIERRRVILTLDEQSAEFNLFEGTSRATSSESGLPESAPSAEGAPPVEIPEGEEPGTARPSQPRSARGR